MSILTKLMFFSSLAILTAIGDFAFAADPIGKVAAARGSPSASGPGGDRKLTSGSTVFEGDTIRASNGGNVQITLNDGTRLVVGPASQLVLQTYLKRNEATASKVAVKALRGYFRFITGKSPKSAYAIQTANATVGIRGTGFDLRVNNRTSAAVLQGSIRLRGGNGQSVNAAAGCGVAWAGTGNTEAKLHEGQSKSNRLRQDFPFILNQGSLLAQFRLPVQNCQSSLAQEREDGGQDFKKEPPPRQQRGNQNPD